MNFIDCYHDLLSQKEYSLPSGYDAAIEETAELLSKIVARYLADKHGDALDFAWLLRPYYYLYLFVYANASYLKPAGSDDGDNLQAILNLNKLSEMPIDGWLHSITHELSRAEDPVKYALNHLETLPRYEQRSDFEKLDDKIDIGGKGHYVGISLSMLVLEKLILWLMSGASLRFVKPRRRHKERVLAIDPESRNDLIKKLSGDTDACQLDDNEYRLLISSVLFLPTYYIEDFRSELIDARKLSQGISDLICGIEFQHKPQIAIALALLKRQGSRLIGSQHGGGYGQTDNGWMQRTEQFIFDRYITWGYQYYDHKYPLPSIRLSRPRMGNIWQKSFYRRFPPERNTIMVVLPVILSTLAFSSHSPNIVQQHEALLRSLELLEPAVNNNYKIVLRMHPWCDEQDYEPAIPDFMRDKSSLVHGKRGSLGKDMQSFGFIMFTHPNATGLSECIANDTTFTIIADPKYYKIRHEAEHVFETLRQADVWVTEQDQVTRVLESKGINDRQKAALDLFGRMYAFHTYAYLGHWSRFIIGLKTERTRED